MNVVIASTPLQAVILNVSYLMYMVINKNYLLCMWFRVSTLQGANVCGFAERWSISQLGSRIHPRDSVQSGKAL